MSARYVLFVSSSLCTHRSLLCRNVPYTRFRLASLNICASKAGVGDTLMKSNEVCWKIVKALLDEFPSSREKTKEYLET
jgi:hypothetical protein